MACARCTSGAGTNGGCNCALVAGDGITVVGTGSPASPWVVSTSPGVVTRIVDNGDGSFTYVNEDGTAVSIQICDLIDALPRNGTIPAGSVVGLNAAGQCVIGSASQQQILLAGETGVTNTIESGETINIVGATGSGITTKGVAGDKVEIDFDLCESVADLPAIDQCDVPPAATVQMLASVDGTCQLVDVPCKRYRLISGSVAATPSSSSGGGIPTLIDNGNGTVTFGDGNGNSTTISLCSNCSGTGPGPVSLVANDDSIFGTLGQVLSFGVGTNDVGGTGARTYSLVNGDLLAIGLQLTASGLIIGTPTQTGTFGIDYRVTDSLGINDIAHATITIAAIDDAPFLSNDIITLPGCTAASYNLLDNDTLGDTPSTTVLIAGGQMPPGMQISAAGVLFGTPTTPGTYEFQYRVTDVDGDTDTATVFVTITSVGGCSTVSGSSAFNTTAGFTDHLNPMSVSGGRTRDTAGEIVERWSTAMPSADMFSEVDVIYTAANPSNTWAGPSVRVAADGQTRYLLETAFDNSSVELLKQLGGVQTSLGIGTVTMAAPGTHKLRLEVMGNVLRGYVNGTLVIGPITDTSITGPAFAGFHLASGGIHAVDNFAAGECSTGCTVDPVDPTPAGRFTIASNGNILDPCGDPWTPVGMAVISRPDSPDITATTGYWGDNFYGYGNGDAAAMAALGVNAVEVMVPIPDPLAPFTMAQSLAGLGNLLDEFTAQGIVCIVYPFYSQGYNPTTYASAPAEVRATQDYLCANYADNDYVWLETLGESHEFLATDGSGPGSSWVNANTECYNDAIAKGWTGIQVFTLAQYGQGIATAANSSIYDIFLIGKSRSILGWHNFGSMPSVAQIQSTISAIKAKNLPIICTSFGQNWKDGDPAYGGDNPASDPIGVDFTLAHGYSTFQTGGIAWISGGPYNTTFKYGLRYANNNGGVHRDWQDTAEPLNEVGVGVTAAAALPLGGGPSTVACTGSGGPVDPPVAVPNAVADTINAVVGTAISINLATNDTPGTTPSVWALETGSFPPGTFSLSSAGLLTGTPTTAGTYSFTYRITDANGAIDSAAVSVNVTATVVTPVPNAVGGTVTVTMGQVASSFAGTANDSIGVGPSVWSWEGPNGIPNGLYLSPEGELFSTPTGPSGTFTFTYRLTDSNGAFDTADMTVIVLPAAASILPVANDDSFAGTIGTFVSQNLAANDSAGTGPSTWSVTSGAPPNGMTLSSTGILSGTPSGPAGSSSFTYRILDSTGAIDTAVVTSNVSAVATCPSFFTSFDVNGGAAANGLYDVGGSVHGATMPLQVSGGAARPSMLSQEYIDCIALRSGFTANQFSEAVIRLNGNYSTAYSGAIVRVANGAGGWQWAWFGTWFGQTSSTRLIFINNGAIADEQYFGPALTPGQQYTFRLNAVGNTYTCLVNGAVVGTYVSSAIAQIGDPGLIMASNSSITETEALSLSVGQIC